MSVFVWFVLSWVLGILLGWCIGDCSPVVIVLLLLMQLTVVIIISLSWSDKGKVSMGFAIVIVLGLLSGVSHISFKNSGVPIPVGQHEHYLGQVRKIKNWGNWTQVLVKLRAFKNCETLCRSDRSVLLKIRLSNRTNMLLPGDDIVFISSFKEFERRDSLTDFNEKAYWAGYGVKYYAWLDSTALLHLTHKPRGQLIDFLSRTRNGLENKIDQLNLFEGHRIILLAMLTGNKTELSSENKKLFSRLGIMHLLAVSGLHAGLVYLLVSKLLHLMRVPGHSPWNRLFSSLIVWVYVLICGFPASAVRAATMISLYGFSSSINRAVSGVHIVFLVALIHTFVQPEVIFSLGFQLSYLAVLGIIVFFPKIRKAIHVKQKIIARIRDLGAISFSAQIFTLPISIYAFASFPVWFLVANIVLMPIGLLIFYLGLALLFMRSASLQIILFEQALDLLMSFWLALGERISELPGSLLEVKEYPWAFFIVYGSVLLLSRTGLRRLIIRPYPLLILFLIWSLHGFLNTFCNNL